MRADRLVAILLLLQNRGQVTAAEVARELEISERTARRDLDALGVAGLPIYSTQGRNGGWRLAGGGRTDLSGLTAAEAEALFLVAGPASATPEVKAALRKLVRALPEPFRVRAQAASSAVLVDPAGWDGIATVRRTPAHLEAVQQAVIEGEQLVLGYTARDRTDSTRVVHPLGLAAKGAAWYLVAGTDAGQRTFRVDRITSVERNGQPVRRPSDFDLAQAWRLITDELDQRRTPLRARVLAAPEVVGWCRGRSRIPPRWPRRCCARSPIRARPTPSRAPAASAGTRARASCSMCSAPRSPIPPRRDRGYDPVLLRSRSVTRSRAWSRSALRAPGAP